MRNLLLSLLLLVPASVFAADFDYLEDFNDPGTYEHMLRMTNGCQHENREGVARFYPPTEDDSYCGLGVLDHGVYTDKLVVSFDLRFGPEYADLMTDNNKMIIANRSSDITDHRNLVVMKPWQGDIAPAACVNIDCMFEDGMYWPKGNDEFRYGTVWRRVKMVADADDGRTSLYIDGELFSTVKRTWNKGSTFTWIDMVGGYYNGGSQRSDGNWFEIDNLIVKGERNP